MSQIVDGHFEPDGGLIYLPIGFVPSFFLLCELGATNPLFYYWWSRMEQDEASGSQEGVIDTAGTKTKAADDGGIVAYDSEQAGPTIADWAASTAYTAPSATAHGSYVRPTTSSTTSRQAVFECVTAGTSGTTEPTWPAEVGENSASDNGVVWRRVNVATTRVGYKGVCIAAALMTDGQEMYYLAIETDNTFDHGDVVGWTSGIYGA